MIDRRPDRRESWIRRISRPLPVTVIGLVCFLAVNWISLALVDFNGTPSIAAFKTGSWFVPGFPFFLEFGIAYGMVFAFVGRLTNSITAMIALFAVSGVLAYKSAIWQLPDSRLPAILGELKDSRIIVHRFRTVDSFRDGMTTYGVLSVPPDLLAPILELRQLRASESKSLSVFAMIFDDSIPDAGTVYSNDRTRVFYDEATEKMYVVFRAR
jgi:hypothetical protein